MFIGLRKRAFSILFVAPVAALSTVLAVPAQAQGAYPSRLIELVVPYPAGGTNDVVARLVADGLTAELGQKVIILNKGGASASIGSSFVARAKPDGHTLLLASQGSHSANPYLLRNISYDAQKDFAPVALVGRVNNVLVVPAAFPVQSMADFVKYAKGRPGEINFSHAGVGTSMSLAGEMFKLKAHVNLVSIPYQGSAAATLAVVAGEVQSMFANVPSAIQQIQAGKLRPLGITGAKADPLLPGVKPIADQGIAGYDIQSWFGIVTTAGTPQPVLATLNAAIRKVLKKPEVTARFAELGIATADLDLPEFRKFMQDDYVAIGDLIHAAGLKPE